MTKNGKKSKKPISKAVFISLMINAGMTMDKGTSATLFGFSIFLIRKKSARSFSLVLRIIKFLKGNAVLVKASS
ncbi:hypothetical protein D3C81_2206450 [compost metagenome]